MGPALCRESSHDVGRPTLTFQFEARSLRPMFTRHVDSTNRNNFSNQKPLMELILLPELRAGNRWQVVALNGYDDGLPCGTTRDRSAKKPAAPPRPVRPPTRIHAIRVSATHTFVLIRPHHLLQRKTAPDHQRRPLGLHQLLLLEFGKQPADGFTRCPDNFRDFLMRQSQFQLRRTVALS